MRKQSALSIVCTSLVIAIATADESNVGNFVDCDTTNFYAPIIESLEDEGELRGRLKAMHRKVVPYTSSAPDIWDALIDLDRHLSDTTSVVYLIYANRTIPSLPHGDSDNWNREHIWPKSHGVGDNGPDYTDLHHLRPSDSNVNSARSNRYFSSCGVVDDASYCVVPAHADAAEDTNRDRYTFLPPLNVRGDVARAIFYMAVRYDGSDDSDGIDLQLSDCPEEQEGHMGYLSQLLEWHEMDPVSEEEIRRNDEICQRWQGNRNPFVDYPNLAEIYFGNLRTPLSDGLGYNCNIKSSPTISPHNVDNGGTCKSLTPGDIMITGFRSDNPDTVVMVALDNIPEGSEIFMTDNSWTGSSFKTTEGVMKLVSPSGGIATGSIFGYGNDSLDLSSDWQSISGSFALSTSGDNIFIYCLSSNETPVFLSGLLYSGEDWSSTGTSAKPESLPSNCAVALPHMDNYVYKGAQSGTREEILDLLTGAENWSGSNDDTFDVVSSQNKFDVVPSQIKFDVAADVSSTKSLHLSVIWICLGVAYLALSS